MNTTKKSAGFFIVELLIVMVIIAILVLTLLPNYANYSARAKFQDVIMAAGGIRTAVDACIVQVGTPGTVPSTCNTGSFGIGASYSAGYLGSINVAASVITATATNMAAAYTYILTPTYLSSGAVSWAPSGNCGSAALC